MKEQLLPFACRARLVLCGLGCLVFLGTPSQGQFNVISKYAADQERRTVVVPPTRIEGLVRDGQVFLTEQQAIEMALRQGAPILPVRIERIEDTRFRVTIHPPLVAPDTDDRHAKVRAILVQYNTLLEAWIRERPGQWFWLHKRWPN